jgi:hypothetical protein
MKYLVVDTIHIFGEKGSSENGGWGVSIETSELYKHLKPNTYYRRGDVKSIANVPQPELAYYLTEEELSEMEEKKPRAYDGYTCTVSTFKVTEISDDLAVEYETIIERYNALQYL